MKLDWLILGLGNPGRQYEATLHNAGFAVLDLLLASYAADPAWQPAPQWQVSKRLQAHCAELRSPAQSRPKNEQAGPSCTALLVKPQTYMNHSGRVLAGLRRRYQFAPQQIVVLLDNLDLPLGRVRLKWGGGFSSHNGLRSLRECGLTANFWRLFIGIGGKPGQQAASYVLSPPPKAAAQRYRSGLERAAQGLEQLLRGAAPQQVTCQLNRKSIAEPPPIRKQIM